MDAQAKLVRYLQNGLKRVRSAVMGRDQKTGFQLLRSGSLVLICASLVSGLTAQAQQVLPASSQQYPATYSEAYYPPQDAATYAALVPDRAGNSERSLFGVVGFAGKHLPDSWIRLEYINALIGHRSGGPLGTPISDLNGNIINTTEQFELPIFDPINMPPEPMSVQAIAPTTEDLGFDNIGGIRGSFGIPLDQNSWIEGSFMGLEEQTQNAIAPTIPPSSLNPLFGVDPVQVIVIPFTIDGQIGTLSDPTGLTPLVPASMIAYDAGFFSDYRINLWSAEVNHVYDLRIPHDGWTLQSILGYRHEEYSEQLSFGGSFDNRSGYASDGVVNTGQFAMPISNRIDSKVHNYRNALQLGFRSEVKQYGLTVGVEPKVAIGLGLIRAQVDTSNVREPGDLSSILGDPNLEIDDPESTTDFDRELDFAPSAELNLYAKYDVSTWLRLKVGYNLTWLGRVGAADKSIRYNTMAAADPTMMPNSLDFGVTPKVVNRYVSAFTIGGEIIFP
ncbi:BBP7 family outer membrane beta-barrel protein [Planctomicrobium sp.]|nr:BBP7 family outer membrane beta-barrel protein [Planctomicrobium sp.]MDA7527449.1 BBP7 family outer membrane beta-barrel protein [bacterium]MDB4731290.1 BBP7 family outer membrane beta-barrel protein [bacterium]MDB4733374.1 BBP7 family outer membrane beta-barrel protein [Planctomicrobium sp.]MDB4743247.1 BBP7 family outer membrane beta-barrel protein [Planctomicrobium sp.]